MVGENNVCMSFVIRLAPLLPFGNNVRIIMWEFCLGSVVANSACLANPVSVHVELTPIRAVSSPPPQRDDGPHGRSPEVAEGRRAQRRGRGGGAEPLPAPDRRQQQTALPGGQDVPTPAARCQADPR